MSPDLAAALRESALGLDPILRPIAELILAAGHPMAMIVGDRRRFLFNHSCARLFDISGDAIGRPLQEVSRELFDLFAADASRIANGEAISHKDRLFRPSTAGTRRELWLTVDFSPLPNVGEKSGGALVLLKDTSEQFSLAERLEIVEDAGGFGLFEWFPETGAMTVSAHYRKMWGLGETEPVTTDVLMNLVVKDDLGSTGPNSIGDGDELQYSEYRHIMPGTGEVRWIARRGRRASRDDGHRRPFFGVAMDITDKKLAEEALDESQQRWVDLIAALQEGVFVGAPVTDELGVTRDLELVETNLAFRNLFAVAETDPGPTSLRSALKRATEETIGKFLARPSQGDSATFEFALDNGQPRWFEARVRELGGSRVAAIVLDITTRKNAEDKLRNSENRFRTLTQFVENHVWTADAAGVVNWCNDRAYEYFGLSKERFDSGDWLSRVHPDDVAQTLEAWRNSVESGQPYEHEFRLLRHDGVFRWHVSRASPVSNGSSALRYWIGTNTDIEDRKRDLAELMALTATLESKVEARTRELTATQEALRQSQKMESLGNLTSGIAHDFNNLLQVVNGNLELLRHSLAGDEKRQRWLRNALSGVERGAKLSSQLLSFGRRQALEPQNVEISRLIEGMAELLNRTLGEGVEVAFEVASDLWNAYVDPRNMETAILNLAVNARDAMNGRGQIKIGATNARLSEFSIGQYRLSGEFVILWVDDTGPGIPTNIADRVFEPFFTTKPGAIGGGLGLSVVYGFVRQSGGYVRIANNQGRGARIELYLPRSVREKGIPPKTKPIDDLTGDEVILVAEDDEAVRSTVVDLVRELGYKVYQAPDARSALALLQAGLHVDLLFTDVVMPGELKSTELARNLFQLLPEAKVLYTSGYTEDAVLPSPREGVRGRLLRKPYTREALARTLREVLETDDRGLDQRSRGRSGDGETAPALARSKDQVARPRKAPVALACEDEPLILMNLADMLGELGFDVLEASDGAAALALAAKAEFDVLITDLGLPGLSGQELATRLSETRPGLPIIFATGRDSIEISISSSKVGFLRKPFSMQTLKAALREVGAISEPVS